MVELWLNANAIINMKMYVDDYCEQVRQKKNKLDLSFEPALRAVKHSRIIYTKHKFKKWEVTFCSDKKQRQSVY